jgi:hypothetical protein
MDASVFAKFSKAGLYDRTLKAKLRHVLERGGSTSEAALFRSMNGAPRNNKAFLRSRGLLGHAFNYAAAANDNEPSAPEAHKTSRCPGMDMG